MLNNSQIFALLFLMLGPFKILGPFVKITKNADPASNCLIHLYKLFY